MRRSASWRGCWRCAVCRAGSDFEALYNLTRLAYGDDIDEPQQLTLLQDDAI